MTSMVKILTKLPRYYPLVWVSVSTAPIRLINVQVIEVPIDNWIYLLRKYWKYTEYTYFRVLIDFDMKNIILY